MRHQCRWLLRLVHPVHPAGPFVDGLATQQDEPAPDSGRRGMEMLITVKPRPLRFVDVLIRVLYHHSII